MTWPFELLRPPDDFVEEEYVALLQELRSFLGAVATADPGRELTATLTADLSRWRDALAARRTTGDRAPYGQLHRTDDHGLAAVPALAVHREAAGTLDATVTFSPWYVGGGGTVHGGHVATALDGLMGRTQLAAGWIARTASLDVTYRAGTPLDEPVQAEVRTLRAEGRKHHLHGRLFKGETTFAEAEALFIRVARYPGRPGTAS
ncbi:MAG: hypothetical protein NTX33_00810 [Propionibacteriales bacterium]|nr:hypothetical protein [Propionibacteriales bacterium]